MSSLRNAVKRITHKERGQLQARSHLGMLEKKVDYKKRSDHYHAREDRLNAMKQKASMKNPDEFYFGMKKTQIHSTTGQHSKTKETKQKEFDETIGPDTIRLMKDQDLRYIRLQKQKDVKKIEKLQSSLHFLENDHPDNTIRKRKHTIFVDTKEEADNFDPVQYFDTVPELVDRVYNRPKVSTLKKQLLLNQQQQTTGLKRNHNNNNTRDVETTTDFVMSMDVLKQQQKVQYEKMKKVSKERNRSYRELKDRMERVQKMKQAENYLVTEQLLQKSKGKRRKLTNADKDANIPAIYQWSNKRLG